MTRSHADRPPASYQDEGSTHADSHGASIWVTFAHKPGNIADGTMGNVGTDSYARFAEDIALLKAYGVCAYRFSVA